MRAVLDTVVFIRALINPKGICGRLLFEFTDRYVIVLSPEIVREVVSVVYRPSLQQRFPQMAMPPHIDRVLAVLREAEMVGPDHVVPVCRDPEDDKFFACALAAGADYLVSEDLDILEVAEYQGIRSVSAAEFTAILTDTSKPGPK
jgi:putative PIN family toxin of toxin-antitoxin system